jgi:PucR C-terminal helix-turn-helix domain/GGDEF-like domain
MVGMVASSSVDPTVAEPGPPSEEIVAVGVRLQQEETQLTDAMLELLLAQIPALDVGPAMVELLRDSVRGNLEVAALVFRGDTAIAGLTAPVGAREYARRLAQHGVEPTALVRAYRLGQQLTLDWSLGVLGGRAGAVTVQELIELNFSYVDAVSEQVVADYQAERERWLAQRSTVREEMLQRIIAGEQVEVSVAENALGYRLRGAHLGAVIWATEPGGAPLDLARLEALAESVGRCVHAVGPPLVWLRDSASAWLWFPVDDAAPPHLDELATVWGAAADVRLATGVVGHGLNGFRATNLDAGQAFLVASLAGPLAERVTSYADEGVRAAAFLAADLPRARRLVADELGGLAATTDAAARLRETVLILLSENGSQQNAAERLHLHKSTVKYRLSRAAELRGRPITEDRLALQLALTAARWLGPAVLKD